MHWFGFFLLGWGFSFTLYVVAQVLALVFLRGVARGLALLPVPFMLFVVVVTWSAYVKESNLWPIMLIFASPVAFAYIAVLCVMGFIVSVYKHRTARKV